MEKGRLKEYEKTTATLKSKTEREIVYAEMCSGLSLVHDPHGSVSNPHSHNGLMIKRNLNIFHSWLFQPAI